MWNWTNNMDVAYPLLYGYILYVHSVILLITFKVIYTLLSVFCFNDNFALQAKVQLFLRKMQKTERNAKKRKEKIFREIIWALAYYAVLRGVYFKPSKIWVAFADGMPRFAKITCRCSKVNVLIISNLWKNRNKIWAKLITPIFSTYYKDNF